jgi:hypothetical protein
VILGKLEKCVTDKASHSRRLVSSVTLLWKNHTACKNSAGNVINNVALRNFCYQCVVEEIITTKTEPPAEAAERHPWSGAVPPHISHSGTFLPPVYFIQDSHSLVCVCVNGDSEVIH